MNFGLLEVEFGIELPKFYKESILNYPFKAVDDLDFVEDNLVRELDWVLENNIQLRNEGFFGQRWLDHYFSIGHDGFGNYVFISLKDNDMKIYFVDHEFEYDLTKLEELEYASSMEEYISMCNEDQLDILGDDAKNI